eukprot:scaffold37282_cov58-Phaeocystis_antarctica.AAC.3
MGAAAAQRFTFLESLARGARELCFAQAAHGPGPLSTIGVLRVLGLARAGPSDIALEGFLPERPN